MATLLHDMPVFRELLTILNRVRRQTDETTILMYGHIQSDDHQANEVLLTTHHILWANEL